MNQPAGQAVTSYLDSSALVKRYLIETGTPWVQAWCDAARTITVAEVGLVEIAAALLRLHPFESLYIADLDAIQGLGTNLPFIAAIHDAFPAVELWIDAGVADLRSWAEWKARSLGRIVIGTESKPEAALIGALRAKNAGPQPLLSLSHGAARAVLDPASYVKAVLGQERTPWHPLP